MGSRSRLTLVALLYGVGLFAQPARLSVVKEHSDRRTSSSRWTYRVELTTPAARVVDDQLALSELSVEGLTSTQLPGKPELPETGTLFAVPEGYDIAISDLAVKEERLDRVLVRPAQKKIRCGNEREFAFDRSVYEADEFFPANWVSVEKVGILSSLPLYRVAIHPVKFQPRLEEARIARELSFHVNIVNRSSRRPLVMSATMQAVASSMAPNVADLPVVIRYQPETFLVAAADNLASALTPFIEWKSRKGFQLKLVTFSQMGGTKEKAKEWIQKFYDNNSPKPTYILFVGNQNSFPTYTESTDNGSAVSDYRYTLLSGNDAIPDVLYGRLVADNVEEVATQIDRWMKYEKIPMMDYAYSMGTTIASSDTQGGKPYDNEYTAMIQEVLKKHTYQLFDDFWQKTGNATPSNIKSSLQRGRSYLTYIGHGSGTSWGSTNGTFSVSTIESMEPSAVLPVVVDVACLNGSWASNGKSFGEAWVKQTKDGEAVGAVAYFGASQSTNWHEPAVMSVGAATAHVEKHLYSFGATVAAGLLHLSAKMGTGANVISNYKWYNLLGDPSLVLRTTTPEPVQVNVTAMAPGNGYTVSALNVGGQGIGNLTVAVSDGQNLLSVQRTDSSGSVHVIARGPLHITVTGYNYMTVETTVP